MLGRQSMRPSQTMPQLHYTREDIQEQYLGTTKVRKEQRKIEIQQAKRAKSSDPKRQRASRDSSGSEDENENDDGGNEDDDDDHSSADGFEGAQNGADEGSSSGRSGRQRERRSNRKRRRRARSASLFSACFTIPNLSSMLTPSTSGSGAGASTGGSGHTSQRRSILAHLGLTSSSSNQASKQRPISARSQTAGDLRRMVSDDLEEQSQDAAGSRQEVAGRKHVSFGSQLRPTNAQQLQQPQQQQPQQSQQQQQQRASAATVLNSKSQQQTSSGSNFGSSAELKGNSVIMRNYQAHQPQRQMAEQPGAAESNVLGSAQNQSASSIYLVSQVANPAAGAIHSPQITYLKQSSLLTLAGPQRQQLMGQQQPAAARLTDELGGNHVQQPQSAYGRYAPPQSQLHQHHPAPLYKRLPAVPMRTQATQTEITAYHLTAAATSSLSSASSSVIGRKSSALPVASPTTPLGQQAQARASGEGLARTGRLPSLNSGEAPTMPAKQLEQPKASSGDEWSAAEEEEEEEVGVASAAECGNLDASTLASSSSCSSSTNSLVAHDSTLAKELHLKLATTVDTAARAKGTKARTLPPKAKANEPNKGCSAPSGVLAQRSADQPDSRQRRRQVEEEQQKRKQPQGGRTESRDDNSNGELNADCIEPPPGFKDGETRRNAKKGNIAVETIHRANAPSPPSLSEASSQTDASLAPLLVAGAERASAASAPHPPKAGKGRSSSSSGHDDDDDSEATTAAESCIQMQRLPANYDDDDDGSERLETGAATVDEADQSADKPFEAPAMAGGAATSGGSNQPHDYNDDDYRDRQQHHHHRHAGRHERERDDIGAANAIGNGEAEAPLDGRERRQKVRHTNTNTNRASGSSDSSLARQTRPKASWRSGGCSEMIMDSGGLEKGNGNNDQPVASRNKERSSYANETSMATLEANESGAENDKSGGNNNKGDLFDGGLRRSLAGTSPAEQRRNDFLTLQEPEELVETTMTASLAEDGDGRRAEEEGKGEQRKEQQQHRSSTSTLSARHHSYCDSDDLLGFTEPNSSASSQPATSQLQKLEGLTKLQGDQREEAELGSVMRHRNLEEIDEETRCEHSMQLEQQQQPLEQQQLELEPEQQQQQQQRQRQRQRQRQASWELGSTLLFTENGPSHGIGSKLQQSQEAAAEGPRQPILRPMLTTTNRSLSDRGAQRNSLPSAGSAAEAADVAERQPTTAATAGCTISAAGETIKQQDYSFMIAEGHKSVRESEGARQRQQQQQQQLQLGREDLVGGSGSEPASSLVRLSEDAEGQKSMGSSPSGSSASATSTSTSTSSSSSSSIRRSKSKSSSPSSSLSTAANNSGAKGFVKQRPNEEELEEENRKLQKRLSSGSPTTVSELDQDEELSTPSFVDSYKNRLAQVSQLADLVVNEALNECLNSKNQERQLDAVAEVQAKAEEAKRSEEENNSLDMDDSRSSTSSSLDHSTSSTSVSGHSYLCCHPGSCDGVQLAAHKPAPPQKPAHLRAPNRKPEAAAAMAVTATSIAAAAVLHTSYNQPMVGPSTSKELCKQEPAETQSKGELGRQQTDVDPPLELSEEKEEETIELRQRELSVAAVEGGNWEESRELAQQQSVSQSSLESRAQLLQSSLTSGASPIAAAAAAASAGASEGYNVDSSSSATVADDATTIEGCVAHKPVARVTSVQSSDTAAESVEAALTGPASSVRQPDEGDSPKVPSSSATTLTSPPCSSKAASSTLEDQSAKLTEEGSSSILALESSRQRSAVADSAGRAPQPERPHQAERPTFQACPEVEASLGERIQRGCSEDLSTVSEVSEEVTSAATVSAAGQRQVSAPVRPLARPEEADGTTEPKRLVAALEAVSSTTEQDLVHSDFTLRSEHSNLTTTSCGPDSIESTVEEVGRLAQAGAEQAQSRGSKAGLRQASPVASVSALPSPSSSSLSLEQRRRSAGAAAMLPVCLQPGSQPGSLSKTQAFDCPYVHDIVPLSPSPSPPSSIHLAGSKVASFLHRRLSHDDTMEAIEDDVEGEEQEMLALREQQQLQRQASTESASIAPPAAFCALSENIIREVEEENDDEEESSISISQQGVLVCQELPPLVAASQTGDKRARKSVSSSSSSPAAPTAASRTNSKQGSLEIANSEELTTPRKKKRQTESKSLSSDSATHAILEHLSRQQHHELLLDEPAPPLESSRPIADSSQLRRETWRREQGPQTMRQLSGPNSNRDPSPDSTPDCRAGGNSMGVNRAQAEADPKPAIGTSREAAQVPSPASPSTSTMKRKLRGAPASSRTTSAETVAPSSEGAKRRGPSLAQIKAANETAESSQPAGSSGHRAQVSGSYATDTSICSSCSCMEPSIDLSLQESANQATTAASAAKQHQHQQQAAGSAHSSSSNWMSQDEGTVITENYWLSHWLYISEHEESEIWRRAIDMGEGAPSTSSSGPKAEVATTSGQAEQQQERPRLQHQEAAEQVPKDMTETGSTVSERNFNTRYKSTTRKMIHRRATIEMYKKILSNNLKREKRVEISRSNGEFGFRIHGSRPVVVSAIERGTSAETCGLQVGDLIYAINGTNILDMAHSDVVKLAHRADSSALVLDLVPTNDFLRLSKYDRASNKRYEPLVTGFLMRLSPSTAQPLLFQLQEQMNNTSGVGSQQRTAKLNEIMRLAWRQRYFVLRSDNCLYWYKSATDIEPYGGINLQGFSASLTDEFSEPNYVIRLVKYGGLPHYLGTNNICDIQTWIDAINKAATEANQNDPYMKRTLTMARIKPTEIPEPDCAGYLYKFSHKRSGGAHWRAAYFVLKDACLYLFRDQQADSVQQASAVYYLHGYRVRTKHIEHKKHTFELIPPNRKTIRPMFLMANSETDKKRWIAALEYSIDRWIEID